MNKSSKVQLIYKLLIVISSAIGLFLNFRLAPVSDMLLYFTTISNLGIFIFYLVSFILYAFNKLKDNKAYYIIKGMLTVNITLTLAVYNFVITGGELYDNNMLACSFVHLITPGLVIVDYILFGKKGNLKYSYPWIWSLSIILYTVMCCVYVALGGVFADGNSYPYPYMNYKQYGYLGVAFNCSLIYAIYMLYCYLIVFLDKLSAKENRK